MRNLYTTGEVRPWEGVGLVIELGDNDGNVLPEERVIVTPERAEELARKLLDLASKFQPDGADIGGHRWVRIAGAYTEDPGDGGLPLWRCQNCGEEAGVGEGVDGRLDALSCAARTSITHAAVALEDCIRRVIQGESGASLQWSSEVIERILEAVERGRP